MKPISFMMTTKRSRRLWVCLLGFGLLWGQTGSAAAAAQINSTSSDKASIPAGWIPPGLPEVPADGPALCMGNFLKPEQGKAVLDHALSVCTNRASWEAYAETVRRGIL